MNHLDPLAQRTLAELAGESAGAARVFARHGLDFCCGGRIPLAEACAKQGLDPRALLRELAAEERGDDAPQTWSSQPLTELVQHIVTRYHAPLLPEIARLLTMAQRVEKVHAGKESCPRGLAAELAEWSESLALHLRKEEDVLFPLIAQDAGPRAASTIKTLETEHDDHAKALARIRALTDDHVPPTEACGTWRALYAGLAEFELELMRHVHLENHVLYPRALQSTMRTSPPDTCASATKAVPR
ncbi:MAG: iron-sulfur cluster repair di-iron protein [Planctomycetes bacterium]|nr:iron-sulfur cluster repair di-iron protein [Planctomycetota bacterium]